MSFRTMSLMSLTFTLLVSIFFFYLSFDLPMSTRGMVIGPGYYPRVVSALMAIASVAGLITNYRNRKTTQIIVDIPRPGYFFFVLILAIVFIAIWQMYGHYYMVSGLAILTLLWFLNPEPASPKKALKTALIGGGLLGFVFVIFGIVLQLRL